MNKYLLVAIAALVLLSAGAIMASACGDSCSTFGYECGTWDICGSDVNCGSCGSGERCSSGWCVSDCQSHDERKCYDGDVYWYDSCGHREGRYDYCDGACRDGRCVDTYYDDEGYWYDGRFYYYDRYRECDKFCNYMSVCSEQAYDGCGGICRRITDGVKCAGGGFCENGACVTPQPAKEEVTVVGLTPYATYVPPAPAATSYSASPCFGYFGLFLIGLACLVLFIIFIWAIVWVARRL